VGPPPAGRFKKRRRTKTICDVLPMSEPTAPLPEYTEVRDEDRFDTGPLREYLRDKLPGAERPFELMQFRTGSSNLTYLLRIGGDEWVLRRPPRGPVAPTANDMAREFRILSRLWRAFYPAPRAMFFCDDSAIIGAPFYVMERRKGAVVTLRQPFPSALQGHPPATYRQMAEAFIDTLADLHAVDYQAIGLGNFGKPEGFLQRQITGWMGRWEKAKTQEVPLMKRLADWFLEHQPLPQPPVILHNDFYLHNVMFDTPFPGRIVAVLDWEMASLGDPMIDLGTALNYWRDPDDDAELLALSEGHPHTAITPGMLRREQMAQRYARRTGRDIGAFPYYLALAYWKYATVVEQLYLRYHRGLTTEPRFANYQKYAPVLSREAAKVAAPLGFRV
jgi:aminoglycoside phosphotransferase (APT) family kinase protein